MKFLLPAMPLYDICGIAKATNYFFLLGAPNTPFNNTQVQNPVTIRYTISKSTSFSFFISPVAAMPIAFICKRIESFYDVKTIDKRDNIQNPIKSGTYYNTCIKPVIKGWMMTCNTEKSM